MATNHNQAVSIPKGEHDDPHELPQQQNLEGSTKIDHTIYSHSDTILPMSNSLQKQQDQTLTPCTHAHDHIAQHINDLKDPTQEHTLYTNEVDASLFTMDTTTPCDYNISPDVLNSEKLQENKINTTQPVGIHSQSKHKYRNVFGDSNIQYHDFNNGDALTFKDKYKALLQQELQNPYWCLHNPIATKSYQISSKIYIETMLHAMYFAGNKETILRLTKSLIR